MQALTGPPLPSGVSRSPRGDPTLPPDLAGAPQAAAAAAPETTAGRTRSPLATAGPRDRWTRRPAERALSPLGARGVRLRGTREVLQRAGGGGGSPGSPFRNLKTKAPNTAPNETPSEKLVIQKVPLARGFATHTDNGNRRPSLAGKRRVKPG